MVMRYAVLLSLMTLLLGAFTTTGCSTKAEAPSENAAAAATDEAAAPDATEAADADAEDADADTDVPAAGSAPQDGELLLQLGGGSGGYQGSQPRLQLDGGLRTP